MGPSISRDDEGQFVRDDRALKNAIVRLATLLESLARAVENSSNPTATLRGAGTVINGCRNLRIELEEIESDHERMVDEGGGVLDDGD